MQNPLSYIIGLYRARRQRDIDAVNLRVENAAKAMFYRMLLEKQQEEVQAKLKDIDERKQLADAWMPFNPKRMTKGQAKALTFFDELQLGALDVIEEEIRAELSNRAMRMDGVERDKAMWAAVGARRYLEAVKQKIEHFGGRKKREEVKAAIEAAKEEKTQPRTMSDLYGERLLVTP